MFVSTYDICKINKNEFLLFFFFFSFSSLCDDLKIRTFPFDVKKKVITF